MKQVRQLSCFEQFAVQSECFLLLQLEPATWAICSGCYKSTKSTWQLAPKFDDQSNGLTILTIRKHHKNSGPGKEKRAKKKNPLVFEFTNQIINDIQLFVPELDKTMKDYCCSQGNLYMTTIQYFTGLQLYLKCTREKE